MVLSAFAWLQSFSWRRLLVPPARLWLVFDCYYDEDDVGSWLHQTVTFETFALHCLWIHRKNVARSWREWLWWWFMIYHVWSYWWLSNDTAIKCRFYGWLLLRWRWWRHVSVCLVETFAPFCDHRNHALWPQPSRAPTKSWTQETRKTETQLSVAWHRTITDTWCLQTFHAK